VPTYPFPPRVSAVEEDGVERRAIAGDYRGMVRHVRNRDPHHLRKLRLIYRSASRADVDSLISFYNSVNGRTSRFDFTHPNPVNIIRNPGWEQGPADWTFHADTSVGTRAESRTGAGCGKIVVPNPALERRIYTNRGVVIASEGYLEITGGRPIFLSGWARASGSGGNGTIFVEFYTAPTPTFITSLVAVDGAIATSWTQYTVTGTTPSNATYMRAMVRCRTDATVGVSLFFDDLVLAHNDPRFKARLVDDRLTWNQRRNDLYEMTVAIEEAP